MFPERITKQGRRHTNPNNYLRRRCSGRDWLNRGAVRFQLSYSQSTSSLLCDSTYRRSVERCLDVRGAIGNPPPVLISVVAWMGSDFGLSQKARKNRSFLQKHVGRERVLLFVISATLGRKCYAFTAGHPTVMKPVARLRARSTNAPLGCRRSRRRPC